MLFRSNCCVTSAHAGCVMSQVGELEGLLAMARAEQWKTEAVAKEGAPEKEIAGACRALHGGKTHRALGGKAPKSQVGKAKVTHGTSRAHLEWARVNLPGPRCLAPSMALKLAATPTREQD